MIRTPSRIYVASESVDLHYSFDRLAGIVRDQLGEEPIVDAAFVFHNRTRTCVKILVRDATGFWILYKRLHRGTYRIPLVIAPGAAKVVVSARELSTLLEGIDRAMLRAARRAVKSSR